MAGTVVCDGDVCRMISPDAEASAAKVSLLQLLGSSLSKHGGDAVDTESLCGKGKYVGLYFSAHWCPPCRGFTPKLAEFYNDFKANHALKDKFEIVFISSDQDSEQFEEYWKSMPWLALPYDKRDLKSKVSSTFKVQGIPTFVILDANTGEVITQKGREGVVNDPKGEEFPWHPKPFAELMKGPLVDKDGRETTAEEALAGKIKLLYFSAHWCPPCRRFTPKFAETYKKLKASDKGDKFEAVFLSSDKDEEAFKEYLAEMPWWAVPHEDRKRKEVLSDFFDVDGIPTLVVLDENNKVITTNGTGALAADPEGAEFPWHPKPLEQLSEATVSLINDAPALFIILDEEDEAKAKETANAAAFEVASKSKAAEEEMGFLFSTKTDDLLKSVMEWAGLQDVLEGAGHCMLILDVQSQKVFRGPMGDVTADSVAKFVADFKAGVVEGKELER